MQVDFRDNSEALGFLGDVSGATFQITNADSNKLQTFNYDDVTHVKKTKSTLAPVPSRGTTSVSGFQSLLVLWLLAEWSPLWKYADRLQRRAQGPSGLWLRSKVRPAFRPGPSTVAPSPPISD